MKPVSVSMQAFGPYLQRQDCDFGRLEHHGIFLITGQTGGGKTSILDAMCFSLFGRATGELRSFHSMRNLSAPDELDTEVEFIFGLRGETYKFIRRLTMYKKRSGQIEERISAESYKQELGEWTLLSSGADSTTKMAETVLGFNHSQFSQVVVLPQGEFRKLLTASSKDKLALLQTLFNTSRWQKLIERALKKVRELESKLSETIIQKDVLLKSVSADNEEMLAEKISEIEKEKVEIEKQAKAAEAILHEWEQKSAAAKEDADLFVKKEQCEKELSLLETTKQDIEALKQELSRASAAKGVYPIYRQFLSVQKEIEEKKKSAEQADLDLKTFKARKQAIKAELEKAELAALIEPELVTEIARRQTILPYFSSFEAVESELIVLRQTEAKQKSDTDILSKEALTLENRIAQGQTVIETINREYVLPFQQKVLRQSVLKEACVCLKQKEENKAAFSKLQRALEQADRDFEKIKTEVRQKEEALAVLERAAARDAAYRLSLSLADGEACPVCGALHHPSPAVLAERCELELAEEMKKELGLQNERLKAAESALTELRMKADAVSKELARLETVSLNHPDNAQTERSEIEDWLALAEENRAKHQKYTDALIKFKEQARQIGDKIKQSSQDLQKTAVRISVCEDKLADLKQKLPENQSAKQFEIETNKLKQEAEQIKKAAETARKNDRENELFTAKQESLCAQIKRSVLETEERLLFAENEYLAAFAAVGLTGNIDDFMKSDEWIKASSDTIETHKTQRETLALKIEEYAGRLKDRPIPDLEQIGKMLTKAKEDNAALHAEIGKTTQQHRQFCSAREQCLKISGASRDLEIKYGQMQRVAALISGKNPHRTPINNFILGLTLDDVVSAASRYLCRFTKDRYTLWRTDQMGGTAIRGLDIEVMDAYRGGLRPVGTLSGGELFLASLSLALGLAEVVESYAGGIRLDSIFIDEGFGSLDAETLELAMNALDMLCKEGRMVGIISHVSELRERIPARIEVGSSDKGVTLSIVAD